MAAALVVVSTRAMAQEVGTAITSPPPNIIVPNYNGVPTGVLGSLEGSADIARASDTSAPWFNPAGLSRAGTQLSGTVGNYQFNTVTPRRLPDTGGSTQHLPNLVGATATFKGFTAGFSLITTVAWGSKLDTVYTRASPRDGSPERFAYSADSAMTQRVTAGAIGYDLGPRWRVGGGVALTSTSIRSYQTISDRVNTPEGIRTLIFASRGSGSINRLRGTFGLQFQPTQVIRLGVVTRTPGITLTRSGSVSLDSTLDGGGPSIGASVYDDSASFNYKLPSELAGGVALVWPRAEIEVDVKRYAAIDPYTLLDSGKSVTIYADPGDGTSGTNVDRPFTPITTAARSVTNFMGGGHVQVLRSPLPLTLHAGIGTDHSQVPLEDDSLFARVDFTVFTLGVSGEVGRFRFAFGTNSRRGRAENLVLTNLVTGPERASLRIKTIGITYSLNYRF